MLPSRTLQRVFVEMALQPCQQQEGVDHAEMMLAANVAAHFSCPSMVAEDEDELGAEQMGAMCAKTFEGSDILVGLTGFAVNHSAIADVMKETVETAEMALRFLHATTALAMSHASLHGNGAEALLLALQTYANRPMVGC